MYGAGLERILGRLLAGGEEGERIAASLVDDELVAMLLLIHDLHPVPLEDRVQGRARLGATVHGVARRQRRAAVPGAGVARIHLRGSCSDCSASSVTLELAIKQALEDAAPDLEGLEVEGVAPQTTRRPRPADGHRLGRERLGADRDGAAGRDVVAARAAVVVRARVARGARATARWRRCRSLDTSS